MAGFLIVTAGVWTASWWALGWPGHTAGAAMLALSLWAVWFFRDPDRSIPSERGAVICPADGVVCFVGPGEPPPELGVDPAEARGMTRVSVFMNVFNVHVNRSPVGGVVERVAYKPGRFFNASFDKASELNERCSLLVRTPEGVAVPVVQIAGLIARRIVCRAREGDALDAGARYGLIRFGSRVDTYLPRGVGASVRVGARVTAGETVLARLAGGES